MTKGKVIQIGLLLSLFGFLSYKFLPSLGFNNLTTSSISNVILLTIVIFWVTTYISRVFRGRMTFMEQRKRYREKYDELMDEKLKNNFDSLSTEEQKKLLKELEDNL